MKWIEGGWALRVEYGAAVFVNGSRVCNIDTMTALIKKGLVQRDRDGLYKKVAHA